MNKKDILQAVVVGEYVAFILASILVIVFQFVGMGLFITLALALYVAAFALCGIENIVSAVELFKVKTETVEKQIPNLNIETEDGERITVKQAKNNIKSRKIKAVFMAVVSLAIAIFTLVVLVLF